MRTKTMLLSALLGTLGSVAVMAQSNVYSLNAVGYINVTCYPGYNIVSCPLICSPDNTLNTLLPPAAKAYKGWQVFTYNPTLIPPSGSDTGLGTAWGNGGTETINPGQAIWLVNPGANPSNITFVGTVPTGPITTELYAGSYNLVGSAIPASGDIKTNSLMAFTTQAKHDTVFTYIPTNVPPTTSYTALGAGWATDPILPWVGSGMWYVNSQTTNNYWIQSYSVTN